MDIGGWEFEDRGEGELSNDPTPDYPENTTQDYRE